MNGAIALTPDGGPTIVQGGPGLKRTVGRGAASGLLGSSTTVHEYGAVPPATMRFTEVNWLNTIASSVASVAKTSAPFGMSQWKASTVVENGSDPVSVSCSVKSYTPSSSRRPTRATVASSVSMPGGSEPATTVRM